MIHPLVNRIDRRSTMLKALYLVSVALNAQLAFADGPGCGLPPTRQQTSWSSESFLKKYRKPSPEREAAIVREVLSGNTPERLTHFVPIHLNGKYKGSAVTLEVQS